MSHERYTWRRCSHCCGEGETTEYTEGFDICPGAVNHHRCPRCEGGGYICEVCGTPCPTRECGENFHTDKPCAECEEREDAEHSRTALVESLEVALAEERCRRQAFEEEHARQVVERQEQLVQWQTQQLEHEELTDYIDPDLAEALQRSLDSRHQVVPPDVALEVGPRVDNHVPVIPFTELEHMCDEFRRRAELGAGAFGTVYRGTMEGSRGTMQIAVKVFRSRVTGLVQADFQREVSIMMTCRHPNVVPLLAVSDDVELCLVMPLLPDRSLEHLLQDDTRCRSCGPEQRVRYMSDIFEGLAYLHTPATNKPLIVHRDIKPDNVLLHGATARLGDVGIAREMAATYTMTIAQGTPLFMDPEYATTRRLTAASDVYSAGVVLFQLLSGKETLHLATAFVTARGGAGRWEALQRARVASAVADVNVQWPGGMVESIHGLAARCTEATSQLRLASRPARDTLRLLIEATDAQVAILEDPLRECVICMSAPRQGLLRPCGHNVVCHACANLIQDQGQTCPLCRRAVQRFDVGNFADTFPNH